MAKKAMKKKKNEDKPVIQHGEDSASSSSKVWCLMAKTINIGNYESFKVEVGFGDDVHSGESMDDAFKRICNKTGTELTGMVSMVEKAFKI